MWEAHSTAGRRHPWLSSQRSRKSGSGELENECGGDDLRDVGAQESDPLKLCMYSWPPPDLYMDLTLNSMTKAWRADCPGLRLAPGWCTCGTGPNSTVKVFVTVVTLVSNGVEEIGHPYARVEKREP